VPRPFDTVRPSAVRVDVHAGGLGHAVALDQDGAFQLGDVLDLLADTASRTSLPPAVAAEGVEVQRPAHRQDFLRVPDDEHGADRLALAAFRPMSVEVDTAAVLSGT